VAITTYATLLAAVEAFLFRDDLSSLLPTALSLAEARMNEDLRLSDMQSSAVLTVDDSDSKLWDLPADFLEEIRVSIGNYTMRKMTLAALEGFYAGNTGSSGEGYAIQGGQVKILPDAGDSAVVTMLYYASPDALDSDTDASTNWLLVRSPQLYMFACIRELLPMVGASSRLGEAEQLYTQALTRVQSQDQTRRLSGAVPRLKYGVV
jgi:hypothetical protein